MKKLLKRIGICLVLAASVWCGSLLADRQRLNDGLIRFHVVANSDSEEDQSVKLQVRDAVLNSLQSDLNKIADVNEARAYLQAKLPQIQAVANSVLEATGCDCEAVVTLCKEAFDTRYYDTFTLPAGIYEALRITIGEGEGHNWWCVVFPPLCAETTSSLSQTAMAAGLTEEEVALITESDGYQLKFKAVELWEKLMAYFR